MIKNYTVKVKSVKKKSKGVIDLANYFIDETTQSHTKTKIHSLLNDKDTFLKNIISNEEEAELIKATNRKGGRPSTEYSKSFTLNFPVAYSKQINQSNSKEILEEVMKDVAKFLGVEVESIAKSSFSVLHWQSNSHIHLMLPTSLKHKKMRGIKSQAFLKMVKQSFTLHTDKKLKSNFQKYKPSSKPTYEKKDILKSQNIMEDTLKKLIFIEKDEKSKKFLNDTLKLYQSGKTVKAAKALKKYESKKEK